MMPKKVMLLVALAALTIAAVLFQTPDSPALIRYTLALSMSVLVIISAWIGIDSARTFTLKSAFGKSLLFISIGVLSWGLGNLAWYIYNITGSEMPYPSFADVGYLGLIPFAAYGLFLLLKSVNLKMDANTAAKLVIPPILVLLAIFPVFIHGKLVEEVPVLIKALNVIYPLGDVIILSFALVVLSVTYGGMLFRSLAIISLGFIIEAAADFAFSYTTSLSAYYTGCWVDILFNAAFLTIGFGMHHMSKSMKEAAKKHPKDKKDSS